MCGLFEVLPALTIAQTRCILYIMRRTQIYLSTEQWKTLHAMSFRTHQSLSDLIRAALDRFYIRNKRRNFAQALDSISGLWADRKDLPDTNAYIRMLRKDTRSGRLRRD